MANRALQSTAITLRSIIAGELGRYPQESSNCTLTRRKKGRMILTNEGETGNGNQQTHSDSRLNFHLRAEVMSRGRTVVDNGIKLSFHSDSAMAPAPPLFLAWEAVKGIGLSFGKRELAPEETVTPEEAVRAIIIEAAHAIHKENEMGNIDIGKEANFTILDENPIKADPKILKDLDILGTAFEGKAHPIKKTSKGMVMLPKGQRLFVTLEEHEGRAAMRILVMPVLRTKFLRPAAPIIRE